MISTQKMGTWVQKIASKCRWMQTSHTGETYMSGHITVDIHNILLLKFLNEYNSYLRSLFQLRLAAESGTDLS